MTEPELPARFEDEAALIAHMTRPSPELVAFAADLPARVVVLGAGGKMGPSLCIRLARAAEAAGRDDVEILAVSRFSDPAARAELETWGITIVRADLLDPASVSTLPDAELVYYLVGQKFGTASDPSATWSTNTVVPTYVCERYPQARFVALSTGNVYAMTTPASGGSREGDAPHPVGEYAASCVGRERVFEHFAARGRLSVVLVRLNYAIDLRYGVLTDLAQRIVAGEPIDLSTGYFNCIWQGDANDVILRAAGLDANPVLRLNVTGTAVHSVREVANELAEALREAFRDVREVRDVRGTDAQRAASFTGVEQQTALLSNASTMAAHFGAPPTPISAMIRWTADWIARGGTVWGKPTHFETRDGRY